MARLPFNLGVGGAMRTGYRHALRAGYDVAVQIDADGQHDPRYLEVLIAELDRVRHLHRQPLRPGRRPLPGARPRRWAMFLLARVLSRLAGTPLTDVTSGFRVCNRRAMTVFAEHYPAEYLGDTVESLVIATRVGCRIGQVPVDMRPPCRRAGERLPRAGRGLPVPGGRRARPRPGPPLAGDLRRGRQRSGALPRTPDTAAEAS